MADLIIKQHDTWPPIRGAASDDDGLIDLTGADSLKLILKTGTTTIEGTAYPIDPPEEGFNWSYTWAAGETDIVGTYQGELEVTWDAGTSPPRVETIPNHGTVEVVIESDLA
jgi:hypothetical protein